MKKIGQSFPYTELSNHSMGPQSPMMFNSNQHSVSQSMHWSGVIKNYARALEGITILSVNVGGARRSYYLRGCVCLFSDIRPHAYLNLFFLSFC